jgi:hypothetical protein
MKVLLISLYLFTAFTGSFAFHERPPAKYRLLVFEGSDWCANCRRLEKTILRDSTFLQGLETGSVELQRLDFPQRKKLSPETRKANETLAERYGFDGNFPCLVLSRTDTLLFRKIKFTNQPATDLLQEIRDQTAVLK